MRFLFLSSDYPSLKGWINKTLPDFDKKTFTEIMEFRNLNLIGVTNFYVMNLRKLGHEAFELRVNNEIMQNAWVREYSSIGTESVSGMNKNFVFDTTGVVNYFKKFKGLQKLKPYYRRFIKTQQSYIWYRDILIEQLEYYKPDIIINQSMNFIGSEFIKNLPLNNSMVIGQIASALPDDEDYSAYDLIITSLPNIKDYLDSIGVRCEFLKLGFEPYILSKIGECNKSVQISFVGSLSASHKYRISFLEYLCDKFDIDIYGTGIDNIPNSSILSNCYKGEAWGIEMYRKLRQSVITLNNHIDMSGQYANNLRLYEATGVGSFLLTDYKTNINDIFRDDVEVVSYRNFKDCEDKIRYYLNNDRELNEVALNGQKKTLKEHSYINRMKELVSIIQ